MSTNSEMNEGTAAAETLKPKAAPGQSKPEMLSTFVQLMSQLGKEDLSKFLNDALAQIGKEADPIADGSAEKNRASVAMKEEIEEIFGDAELTEEFKEKASTIFEAVLNTKIVLEQTRLQEELDETVEQIVEDFEAQLEVQKTEIMEEIAEALDKYLDHAAETYMEENSLAIDSALKTEITESFILGLRNLFAENYIEVPEERLDILGEMKAEIESLKTQLNEALDSNIELSTALQESAKAAVIEEAVQGLVSTQAEKLRTLAENVEFTDVDSYAKKLSILKEGTFSEKAAPSTGILTEEIAGSDDSKTEYVDPRMAAYAEHISRSVK